MQLVVRLTKDIVETYQICNPLFKYSEELNPKRYLTSPSVGVLNDGYDNVNSDLILAVNLVLVNAETQRRFVLLLVIFLKVAVISHIFSDCFLRLVMFCCSLMFLLTLTKCEVQGVKNVLSHIMSPWISLQAMDSPNLVDLLLVAKPRNKTMMGCVPKADNIYSVVGT